MPEPQEFTRSAVAFARIGNVVGGLLLFAVGMCVAWYTSAPARWFGALLAVGGVLWVVSSLVAKGRTLASETQRSLEEAPFD